MRLTVIRSDDTLTHVALAGRLEVKGVNDIQFDFLLQTTSLCRPTMVDISEVSFIGSMGLGMLVAAAKHLNRNGYRMVLVAPSESVRKTLEVSYLQCLIPIADDTTAAQELLGSRVS